MAAVCCASTSRRAIVARRLRHALARLASLAGRCEVPWVPSVPGCRGLGALCLVRCLVLVAPRPSGRPASSRDRSRTRRRRASRRAPSRRSSRSASPSCRMHSGTGTSAPAALAPVAPSAPLAPVPLAAGAVRAFLENGEHLADLHVGALLVLDAGEHARAIGADLEIDLLGLELDERLAGGHLSPCFFSHFATRASTTDSPSSGTTMLVDITGNSLYLAEAAATTQRPAGRLNLFRQHAIELARLGLRLEYLIDDGALVGGVPARRSFRRARVARAADVAQRMPAVDDRLEHRPRELPRAHVLRLFLDPAHLAQRSDSDRSRRESHPPGMDRAARRGRRRRSGCPCGVRWSADRRRPCRCTARDGAPSPAGP